MVELLKKIKVNFWFDYCLIKSGNLKLIEKINYCVRRYFCILFNKRRIEYLGGEFQYDNRFSPALLEVYPLEIYDLNKKINLKKIKSVLDIGANIGQFSYTLKKFYPELEIHSIEPNKEVYFLLKKNLSKFKKIKTHNFGFGKKTEKRVFFFSPEATAEGSFYKENIYQNFQRRNVKETEVEIIYPDKKNIKKFGLKKDYGLIKIDVEGAEMEVLKSLKNIKTKYLAVEISVNRKGSSLNEIESAIKKTFGKSRIINLQQKKNSPEANVLFEIE